MMKKITITVLFLFTVAFTFAQTIVETTPQNKKAILEEFTGIHCQYCPDGHAIANSIKVNNPDDFFVINVHTGGFAVPGDGEPDFRTDYGSDIAGQSDLAGYPAGTINRHYFGHSQSGSPSGATALGRGTWTADASTIMAQPSYVNVAVEADVDNATRIITVHVEAYYTGSSPEGTNFINVALAQNNTTGPQTGGGAGSNYNHMHRLVDMITGQWGFEVATTTVGSFVDQTFTTEIPLEYNGIPVNLNELEVVAFVTETHQEIISGNGATVTKTDTPLYQNDASLYKTYSLPGNCSGSASPIIKINNLGSSTVTSLDFEYSINGEATQTYNWSGSLASLTTLDITLPETSFTLQEVNTVTVNMLTSDAVMANNSVDDRTFNLAPDSTETVIVQIVTDNWGYELNWNIKNSNNVVVASGGGNGNAGSAGAYANNINIIENYTLPTDCYVLEVLDSYGDGGNAIGIRNQDSDLVTAVQGGYGFGAESYFSTSNPASTLDYEFSNVVMYPNPSSEGMITFANAENLSISIFNVLGKEVLKTDLSSNIENVNISNINSGLYLVNLTDGDKTRVIKLIIK